MEGCNLTSLEIDQIRRENKKLHNEGGCMWKEFKVWFVRGVAFSLAFILTTGVVGTGAYFITKKVVENKIEKMIGDVRVSD